MAARRVMLIMGTRPEAIKLAPLALALRSAPAEFDCTVVGTGQQREMLPQALAEFGLEADVDLALMRENQTLSGLTARLIAALDPLFARARPDWVVVQGDTTSAMAGSLVGFYNRLRVAHVEAGLRTQDRFAPYPEEVNRRVIGNVADLHFAVTEGGRANLLREGVCECSVRVVGNTGIDALLWVRDRMGREVSRLPREVSEAIRGRRVVTITGHRRENFDEGIRNICLAVRDLAARFEDVAFVYPVHFNPNVRGPVQEILSGHERIVLTEPLSYRPFVELLDRSELILTDSGGVQEEAPSLGKPVLVMRETTERPEGVDAGNALLVGTDRGALTRAAVRLLTDEQFYGSMAHVKNPYGDGRAAERIAEALARAAPAS